MNPSEYCTDSDVDDIDVLETDVLGVAVVVDCHVDDRHDRGGALESHPAVAGAAVVGRRDERLGETPVAMVELRESSDAATLISYLRNRLARYEIPTEIAIVAELPRTPSGKPDLGAIRRHFSEAPSAAREHHAE